MNKVLKANIVIDNLIKVANKTKRDLSIEMGIDESSLYNYIKGEPISNETLDLLFNYIVFKGYDLFNLIKMEDDSYFYHMSSNGIKGIISANYNIANRYNDFGHGFYLSESFTIACLYMKEEDQPHIYRFKKDKINQIKQYRFKENIEGTQEWVLYIGLNRQKIHNEINKTILNEKNANKLNNKKCLIGKIADSLNFYIMDDFFNNNYDIFQVKTQLTKANLGLQHAIKDEKIANDLKWDDEFVIDNSLKRLILKWKEYKNKILRKDNFKSINLEETKEEYRFNNIIKRLAANDE